MIHELKMRVAYTFNSALEVIIYNKDINPLRPKSNIAALIVVNKINFLKECALKPSTQTTIFPRMNGLLLRGFRQITRYTYAYNIVSYLNNFTIPNVSHYRFSEAILKESDLSIIQWRIYGKGKSETKNL